ncbi:hypothetical protein BaRGS_00031414 [Batillaria attramentaria]|uniref:Uncharacterized protein n=1 Tax=Batillaria attramentaria TaxID=370345 RepID=A0ABD0JQS8_9CAEN
MQVCSVLWSEEYRELVSAQSSADTNSILLWSAKDLNLQLFARLAPPQGRPLHQCLSPDGSTLVPRQRGVSFVTGILPPCSAPVLEGSTPLSQSMAAKLAGAWFEDSSPVLQPDLRGSYRRPSQGARRMLGKYPAALIAV